MAKDTGRLKMGETETLQLRDIHLPEPVSWWPPAPGWWALFLLLILMFFFIRFMFRLRERQQVRVAALHALEKLSADFTERKDARWLVKELSVLLRRISLSYVSRNEVAGLTGEAWLHFLDTFVKHKKWRAGFSDGPGRALVTAPYQPAASVDGTALLDLCREWVKHLPPLSTPRSTGGKR